jgi:hypothetical protein
MLNERGEISFIGELVRVVNEFLEEYEEQQGALMNDLERGLVVSYVLGVMRCQLDALWDEVGQAPVYGSLHPRLVFHECVSKDEESLRALHDEIRDKLAQTTWFTGKGFLR